MANEELEPPQYGKGLEELAAFQDHLERFLHSFCPELPAELFVPRIPDTATQILELQRAANLDYLNQRLCNRE